MSGRIAEKDLRQLQIPLPEDHARIGAEFIVLRERIKELDRLIQAEQERIKTLARRVIEGR